MTATNNRKTVAWHGYKLVERAAFFELTKEVPKWAELRERASLYEGEWIVYDPEDDSDGWLLVGNDPEALARETVEVLCL